jgi:predicted O-methyltransferase YrrM
MSITAPVKKSADEKYTRVGAKVVHELRRRRGTAQVARIQVPDGRPLQAVDALRQALLGHATRAEQQIITDIEAVRQANLLSSTILEGIDGHPDRSLRRATEVSKPPRWAYLLFRLMREIAPVSCLEMGTSVGISAAYQAAALALNGSGELITLEGSNSRSQAARETLLGLGLSGYVRVLTGRFNVTLPMALELLPPLDWAFIDGDHKEKETLAYTEQVLPFLANQAVLVYDDINWSPGMKRAWRKLQADPRFSLTIDLRSVGIVIFDPAATMHQQIKISYA